MEPGLRGEKQSAWPVHSAFFWCGLLAGLGVGLLAASALVELELLGPGRKAWVSLLGAVVFGVGVVLASRRRSAD